MSLAVLHAGLANTAAFFIAILAAWALYYRLRSQPLDSSWYGAAVIGEVLLLGQVAIGTLLYFQGLDVLLARPFMHILYGVVAILTLPAAYSYFGNLDDENVKSLAMAFACFFLWGIVMRAAGVVSYVPPV